LFLTVIDIEFGAWENPICAVNMTARKTTVL
jgi:hypothetical protein